MSRLCPSALVASLAPVATAVADPNAGVSTGTYGDAVIDLDGTGKEHLGWMDLIGDNGQVFWAYSPSMQRDVPFVWLYPEGQDKFEPRPTLYTLNGASGGTGDAHWLFQTDIQDFFRDKNVNVVIPYDGFVSYYTDWGDQDTHLGTQYWETFLTQELPGSLEAAIGSTGQKRGLVGMSMSGTTSLVYAQHHPGLYDAVASYSGCAQTSDPFGQFYV